MAPHPMNRQPNGPGGPRIFPRVPQEARIVIGGMSLLLSWMLISSYLGLRLGTATAFLAALFVAFLLFRHRVTPAHLPVLAAVAVPVMITGLWLS